VPFLDHPVDVALSITFKNAWIMMMIIMTLCRSASRATGEHLPLTSQPDRQPCSRRVGSYARSPYGRWPRTTCTPAAKWTTVVSAGSFAVTYRACASPSSPRLLASSSWQPEAASASWVSTRRISRTNSRSRRRTNSQHSQPTTTITPRW